MQEILSRALLEKLGLEIYYNGDGSLTEFRVKCYAQNGQKWRYLGMYTPDFLIIQRKGGEIYKAIIVETKGALYAHDPTFVQKKTFMQGPFLAKNNEAYGYPRFDYLYLEDTMKEQERITVTAERIKTFFTEEK